jgi:hypothetical protein
LFHDVFDRHSVCHVSLWQTSGDALEIASDHVYPPETDPSYFPKLPINDGVAGLVFTDSQPRYVPRLFAPINGKRQIPFVSSFFGHAMKFEIRQSDGGRLEVVNPKMDLNAFKSGAPNERFTFKSFVSVPVVPVGAKNPIGVLNFDFDATDPLSTVDVKTAVFLALLLGDELQRLHADVTPS